jgi:DNA-binding HxlR family transcriptional regulator
MFEKEGIFSSDRHIEVTIDPDGAGRYLRRSHDQSNGHEGGERCPVQDIFNRLGDRWSLVVIMRLSDGPIRFGQLLRSIEGVSQRMLTVTLKGLEENGLVHRQVLDTRPPQVEYRLTALGNSLLPGLAFIADWATRHEGAMDKARQDYRQRI